MDTIKKDIIEVTEANLDKVNICCGDSSREYREGYERKKELMRNRFREGYRFKKIDMHHKAFIEYVPAEYAWCPIDAPGYMFINCFCVSGKDKKHGLGNRLLEECIKDSEEKNGLIVVSSNHKKPYLSEKKFFIKKGFQVFDEAPPYFELLGIKFNHNAPDAKYLPIAKQGDGGVENGLTIYYTNQCSFTEHYADIMIKMSSNMGIEGKKILIDSNEEARKVPSGYGIFNVFYKGKFLSHEMMGEKKFEKLIGSVRDLW